MSRISKRAHDAEVSGQAEAEAAIAATETDDDFVDADESLEAEEERS
jgi:hypothetical protein